MKILFKYSDYEKCISDNDINTYNNMLTKYINDSLETIKLYNINKIFIAANGPLFEYVFFFIKNKKIIHNSDIIYVSNPYDKYYRGQIEGIEIYGDFLMHHNDFKIRIYLTPLEQRIEKINKLKNKNSNIINLEIDLEDKLKYYIIGLIK